MIFALKSLQEKRKWLNDELQCAHDPFTIHLSRFQKAHQKKLIFEQFYEKVNQSLINLRNTKPFTVFFKGEGGIDEGGLRREAITLIYEELIDPKNEYFELQEDGFLVPSNKCQKEKLEVIGAFIACCFYSGNSCDFHLHPKFWAYFISSTELVKDEQLSNELIDEACISLKKGFNKIVPEIFIRYFTKDDIQKLTCGNSLSFEKFISYCEFYDNNIQEVFTQAVSTFSPNELKKLLQFITGSQTLPFKSNFSISISFASPNGKDENKWKLPVAHTCFSSVDICPFTNPSILSEKLKMAMLQDIISDGRPDFDILNFE